MLTSRWPFGTRGGTFKARHPLARGQPAGPFVYLGAGTDVRVSILRYLHIMTVIFGARCLGIDILMHLSGRETLPGILYIHPPLPDSCPCNVKPTNLLKALNSAVIEIVI